MRKLYFLALSVILFSCSGDSASDQSEDGIKTLEVNNVYVQGEPKGWRDIVISDGDFTRNSQDDIYYPEDNVSYVIDFLELQLGDGMHEPKTLEQTYNAETDIYKNEGTEGVIFYNNFKFENGEYASSDDLFDIQGYVRFEVLSENSFKFYIELIDGRKFQGSYTGDMTILDKEYSFAPDVFWEEE
ncbi:hypothetical protein NE848_09935 [Gramella jeungdoensis]|uniref:Uncharacterized protein n=1 Tax=Gramella jeungdoensis TaxID=708091 RepID=A0ABT0Z393_9FLAO|nr:hypothetical protein [Gramella jeungdoensis]MCM8569700.1 hypothetical protein [Gramella jeungdoensis]